MIMRESKKVALTMMLIAMGVTGMTGCAKEPDLEEVSVDAATTTQEFSETDNEKWINSNYKKYWYNFDEDEYSKIVADLTDTGQIYEGYNVYFDKNGEEVVIMGMDVVPKIFIETQTNFQEKTGLKIYTVQSEEDKEALLNRAYTGASFVNGEKLPSTVSLLRKIDDEIMINLTDTLAYAHLELAEMGTQVKIRTHSMDLCNNTITDDYSNDTLQEAVDLDYNMYYTPVKMTDDSKIYVTQSFATNVLGWDVIVDPSNIYATVWMDNIYKPTNESVEVILPATVVAEQEEPVQPTQNQTANSTSQETQQTTHEEPANTQPQSSPSATNSSGRTPEMDAALMEVFGRTPEEQKKRNELVYANNFKDISELRGED